MLKKLYIFMPMLLIILNLNSASLIDPLTNKGGRLNLNATFDNNYNRISWCGILCICWHKLFCCCYPETSMSFSMKVPFNKNLVELAEAELNEYPGSYQISQAIITLEEV